MCVLMQILPKRTMAAAKIHAVAKCPDCCGSGKMECTDCTPGEHDTSVCVTCNNTSLETCETCQGRGTLLSDQCKMCAVQLNEDDTSNSHAVDNQLCLECSQNERNVCHHEQDRSTCHKCNSC